MNINFKVWLETNELVMPKLFEKVKQLQGKYSGVHFSKTNQLSFNVNPHHYDPIGIYIFPKDYVLSGGLERNQGFTKNIFAFLIEETPNAKVLNLNMNMQTAEDLLSKMGIDKNLLNSEEIYHNSNQSTPGHKFWGVLEHVRNKDKLSRNMSWNSFFAKTGYNTLYDPGFGIVHYNEPTQVIFLDHKAYKIVDVINNDNKLSLATKFASFFPDFRIYKMSPRWKDPQTIKLKKESESELEDEVFNLQISKHDFSRMTVSLYGYETKGRYEGKEWAVDIKSNEDLKKLVFEIKDFMKTNPRRKKREAEKYEFINKISQKYRLKIDPNYPAVIEKRYKNAKFQIKQSHYHSYEEGEYKNLGPSLTLIISSNSLWHRYAYYYSTEKGSINIENVEKSIKLLFDGIKEEIKKDIEDEDSRRKYDAPYALKFVEFLENRVFVKRK